MLSVYKGIRILWWEWLEYTMIKDKGLKTTKVGQGQHAEARTGKSYEADLSLLQFDTTFHTSQENVFLYSGKDKEDPGRCRVSKVWDRGQNSHECLVSSVLLFYTHTYGIFLNFSSSVLDSQF